MPTSPIRRGALPILLLAAAVAQAEPPASCPQIDLTQGLPPIVDTPQLEMQADDLDSTRDGLSKLSGSVRVSEDGREFRSTQLDYDGQSRIARTDQPSIFRDRSLTLRSMSSEYDFGLGTGVFLDNRFTIQSISGRGQAERIDLASKEKRATLSRARFTTCAPEHESWLMTASSLMVDEDSGEGIARNAVLNFQGLPIFWVPYLQFPIDGLRHSGFLFPIVGNSSTNGADFSWPLYLSLAPNVDSMLVPRYLSKRGAQIGGDLRYQLARGEGSVFGEYLPSDEASGGASRSFVQINHAGRLADRVALDVNYGEVSDLNYLSILGGGLDITATPYLDRYARLSYQAGTPFKAELLVQGYQLLASPSAGIAEPYRRLPELRIDALTKNDWNGARLGFDGTFTNFERGDTLEGQRMIAVPYLRWSRDRAAWFATAQADLDTTAYRLQNTASGQQNSPGRTLPVISADTGLRFERMTGGDRLQTLEPRLFYLYVPYRNQDDLPLFDAGQPDFDIPQLFARNRYSGDDRIADQHSITAALTTRLIEPDTGIVRLTGTFGVIDYLRAPRVPLPGFALPSAGISDYLFTLNYRLTRSWSLTGAAQVQSAFDRLARDSVALRYRDPDAPDGGRRLDLAYRYRAGLLEQTDMSFSLPIVDAWRLATRVRYSLRDQRSLESFVGGQYDTCCWALSATYRRFLVGGSLNRYSNGFFFQLELKGLSRIGNSFEALLPNEDAYGDPSRRFIRR